MKPDWKDAPCNYQDCDSNAISKGFCDKHYRRWRKYGFGSGFFRDRHGERNSAEYRVWSHIKGRCLNPSDASFKHYGGRGIVMCKSWSENFSSFLSDMGKRPSDNHQIDRIDNESGYSPDNCRWVLQAENNQNRRSTKLTSDDVLEIRGSEETGEKIANKYGISISQALRVKNGSRWSNIEGKD